MSSNTNNTNNNIITRTNYEEYFILYMDGELTAEETVAVENFLAANPDLQEEMDILLSTKLPGEDFSIDKESLLSYSMKLNAVDEALLLYVDDELNGDEKKEVEKKISTNVDYNLQHQLLLKTKLDANDKIVYPFKEELYRHTERKIGLAPWLRVAAAAVLVVGVSAVLWFNNKAEQPGNTIANNTKPVKVAPQKNIDVASNENIIREEAAPQNIIAKADDNITNEPQQTKSSEAKRIYKDVVTNPEPAQQIAMVADPVTETREKLNETITAPVKEMTARQHLINMGSVTPAIAVTLNNIEASQQTNNEDALATNDNSKTVKGFLRKATRFIERRTNINPVNDDDELLIGVVAIKLK